MSMVTQTNFDIHQPKGPIGQVSRPQLPFAINRFITAEDVHVGGAVKLNADGKLEMSTSCVDAGFIGVVFRDPTLMSGAPSEDIIIKQDTTCEVMIYGHIYLRVPGTFLAGQYALVYDAVEKYWVQDVLPAIDGTSNTTQLAKYLIFDETNLSTDTVITSVQIRN